MMHLAEIQPVATAALPLATLKDHLRLPDGFPDGASTDAKLEQSLRASLGSVEARTGKALFVRQFRWRISDWGRSDRVTVPVAPVVSLDAAMILAPGAADEVLDVADFIVMTDIHKPAMLPRATQFPVLARGAEAEFTLSAGFAASWDGIPADLREATLILAADYFDASTDAATKPSPAVEAVLQRYRGLSLGRIGG